MAKTAQSAAKIAGERAHVGPLAAFRLQDGVVRVGDADKIQPGDLTALRVEHKSFLPGLSPKR